MLVGETGSKVKVEMARAWTLKWLMSGSSPPSSSSLWDCASKTPRFPTCEGGGYGQRRVSMGI